MNLNVKRSINPDNLIFLLGGHDLEMMEIKSLLDSSGLAYHDRNLSWGAKLSEYDDLLDKNHLFIGIELIADIPIPSNYIEIDHHNEKAHLPSSIEQVADMLGIVLNRRQKLIAANDKGYISEMQKSGASPVEIAEIRLLDRKGQGVTDKDEMLAVQSINEFMTIYQDVTLVYALTEKFSPITDRLYPNEKLLIVYDDHLVYYGKGVEILINHYQNLVKQHKAFHGGVPEGFFGIASGHFSKQEIEKTFVPQILKFIANG